MMPPLIAETIENLGFFTDRNDRIQALISIGQRYRPLSPEVATRPYPEEHRVPGCESEVFIWGQSSEGKWHFDFAVDNPQGLSAMAMAVILQESLEGLSASEIAEVPDDVVYSIFGRELSMGKSMGLMNMVQMCKRLAQRGTN